MARLRRAGSPWRVQAWEWVGPPSPLYGDRYELGSEQHPNSEFDELAVGQWLHIEQLDTGQWWMNIGGVTVHCQVDRDGRPKAVSVDLDEPVPGCRYDLTWSDTDG